jgi:hypothetical protein
VKPEVLLSFWRRVPDEVWEAVAAEVGVDTALGRVAAAVRLDAAPAEVVEVTGLAPAEVRRLLRELKAKVKAHLKQRPDYCSPVPWSLVVGTSAVTLVVVIALAWQNEGFSNLVSGVCLLALGIMGARIVRDALKSGAATVTSGYGTLRTERVYSRVGEPLGYWAAVAVYMIASLLMFLGACAACGHALTLFAGP